MLSCRDMTYQRVLEKHLNRQSLPSNKATNNSTFHLTILMCCKSYRYWKWRHKFDENHGKMVTVRKCSVNNLICKYKQSIRNPKISLFLIFYPLIVPIFNIVERMSSPYKPAKLLVSLKQPQNCCPCHDVRSDGMWCSVVCDTMWCDVMCDVICDVMPCYMWYDME